MTQSATPPAAAPAAAVAAPTPVELMDQVARAAAAYYRHFATLAADRGLTLMQGKTLSLLREPRPMRTLADLLACDASNVTGIVDRLEARGLVRREVDPADRRIKNVLLTEEGEQAVREIRAELVSGLTGLEQLDEADRHALQRLLGLVFPG
ncbi:MarR family transcriptional regulator [Kitasatospora sp. NBC_01250]|uniref:MarR family winged helix-turn-helix transcriptional regulator n=1 Tax=unclassified Kitasatospora TaxID=2633591 RepID=UPI002E0ED538|nr:MULTISPECIES: MarR family transcriptional regulator [unclassified Kitasatospora]WSJ70858.1 MarR family transcriptional regulator [Kitasatospora sp. NBC_01302]